MKRLYYVVVFICLSGILHGQQFKMFSGKIVHDSLQLSGIHVVNISRANAVITECKIDHIELLFTLSKSQLVLGDHIVIHTDLCHH